MGRLIRALISPTIKIIVAVCGALLFVMHLFGVVDKEVIDIVAEAILTVILANIGINEFKFVITKYKLEKVMGR